MAECSLENTKEMAKEEENGLDPVSPPDRHDYEKSLATLTKAISEKQKQIDRTTVSNKRITDQLHLAGTKLENAEQERSKIMAELKSTDETIRKLGSNFLKQREMCNHLGAGLKFKTEEMYNEQITKLESQLQSSHFSLNDRRKLQQTIDSLKEGKTRLNDYLKAREDMDKIRNEQDELRKSKDVIHLKNKLCREKITSLRDEITRLREELEKNKVLQREKKNVQDGITKEINDLYQQRKQLKDEFRQKESNYVKYLKSAQTKKPPITNEKPPIERKTIHNRHTLKVDTTHKDTLSFEEEKSICHALITYLSRLNGTSSPVLLTRSLTSASPTALTVSIDSPVSKSPDATPSIPVRSSTSDGTYHRKTEDEEQWVPAGHRDRKDRRKSKRRKSFSGPKTSHKSLHHNATIFSQFSRIGLRPPITSAEITSAIEQLKNKLIQYELVRTKAESEAGDSGIMSSTGISEYSDIGINNDTGLTSGEVTPNKLHINDSPSPTPTATNEGCTVAMETKDLDQNLM